MRLRLGILSVSLFLCFSISCKEGKTPPPSVPEPPRENEPAKQKNADDRTPEQQAEYRLDLADVHLKHRNYPEAIKIYLEVQGSIQNVDLVGRATYGVALVHIAQGNAKLAVGPLSASIATALPTNKPELQFLLVALHAELGNSRAAEEVLDAMLRDPEASPQVRDRIYRQLVDLYEKGKDFPGLAAKLEKRVAVDPKDRDSLFVLGQLYAGHLNDAVKALVTFEKLLVAAPDDVPGQLATMEVAVRAEKAERAVEISEKLLQKVEKEPQVQVQILRKLGDLFLQQKAWDRAVAALERADPLSATPSERDEIRTALYHALKQAGKLPAKVEELEKAVAAHPKDEAALRGLLWAHWRFLDAIVKAEEVLEQLLGINDKDPVYLSAGIDLARQKGKQEKIADYFERLLEANVRTATELIEVYLNALQILGKLDRGVEALLKMADRDRQNRVAALGRAATGLGAMGKKDEATRLWQRMLTAVRESRSGADYFSAVSSLKRANLVKDGWDLAQEALRLKMDAATQSGILLECVDLLAMQGKSAEAEKLCREIVARPDVTEQARQAAQRKSAEIQKAKNP